MARVKVKTVQEVNEDLQNSEFSKNIHSQLKDHITDRDECPYCAMSIRLVKGNPELLKNPLSLSVKRSCGLVDDKNSTNVKNKIHLIFSNGSETVEYIQTSGNQPDDFIYDEE